MHVTYRHDMTFQNQLMNSRKKSVPEFLSSRQRSPLWLSDQSHATMRLMRYGHVAGIDRPVARIVLGSTSFAQGRADLAKDLIETYLAAGGNIVDTAAIYGGGWSDRNIGEWLRTGGRREDILILSKGAHHDSRGDRVSATEISYDLGLSLERMGTDHVDLYVLHRDDPNVHVSEVMNTLHHHHARGRIRAIGGSNWSIPRIEEANAYARQHDLVQFSASSPNIALAVAKEPMWANCISISGDEASKAWYGSHAMPLFSWSSQAGGFFSGRFRRDDHSNADMVRVYYNDENWARYDRAVTFGADLGLTPTQVALAWVLNQPGLQTHALVGPATVEELQSSLAVADLEFSPEQVRWLSHGDL
jgi:aryl-alcohol dehydrogenase-like predicted oxidoreductase